MKKFIAITAFLLMVLCTAHLAQSDKASWNSVRSIVEGYRDIASLVENSIALVKTFKPSPGSSLHITTGLGDSDFDELAVKLSSGTGGYTYLLEVWTKRGGTWNKGMEYSYTNASTGEIILNSYAFSTAYSDGSLHRIVFNHATDQREMTVYSVHTPSVYNVEKSIGTATEVGGFVDLYFTAHLDTSFFGSSTNDAYLFGARISTTSPYYCTAKQGAHDQGDAYNFTADGIPHGFNAGLFTDSGFIDDGKSGGGDYPPESSVDASNLPTAAMVDGFTVSFQSTADPDFI